MTNHIILLIGINIIFIEYIIFETRLAEAGGSGELVVLSGEPVGWSEGRTTAEGGLIGELVPGPDCPGCPGLTVKQG